jgi:hypothetical protein
MNVDEVPQDQRNFKEGEKLKKLMYAVDKDGKYTGVNSAGWEAENFATKQAWDDIDEELAKTEAQVLAGELSPIPYYMQKNLMDVALLAKYMNKWEWQIKRHFKPSVFNDLKPATLDEYARIFNITTDKLTHFGQDKKENHQ